MSERENTVAIDVGSLNMLVTLSKAHLQDHDQQYAEGDEERVAQAIRDAERAITEFTSETGGTTRSTLSGGER